MTVGGGPRQQCVICVIWRQRGVIRAESSVTSVQLMNATIITHSVARVHVRRHCRVRARSGDAGEDGVEGESP